MDTNTSKGHEQRAKEIAAEAAKPYRGTRSIMHPNQRAEQIHRLLREHYDCCLGLPETALGDMLADMRHFAHAYGLDFEHALADAKFHFTAELEEEREDENWDRDTERLDQMWTLDSAPGDEA